MHRFLSFCSIELIIADIQFTTTPDNNLSDIPRASQLQRIKGPLQWPSVEVNFSGLLCILRCGRDVLMWSSLLSSFLHLRFGFCVQNFLSLTNCALFTVLVEFFAV